MYFQKKKAPLVTIRHLVLIVVVACVLNESCTMILGDGGTNTGNAQVVGMLYNPDSTPAVNAKVSLIPADYNPRSGGNAVVDSTYTDAHGNYSFKTIPSNVYNVFGSGKSGVSCINKINVITNEKPAIPNDTLKAPGTLRGVVRLQPGDDSRTVFVIMLGTQFWTVPADSIGNFSLPNMAEGDYTVRFMSTLDVYTPLDLDLHITAGKDSTLKDTIWLPFKGIPAVTGLTLTYDTVMQKVSLRWTQNDTSLIKYYNVYRRNVDSNTFFTMINSQPIKEAAFVDSLFAPHSAYDPRYLNNKTFEYKVCAVDKNDMEGLKSTGMRVKLMSTVVLVDSVELSGLLNISDFKYSQTGELWVLYHDGNNSLSRARKYDAQKQTVTDWAINATDTAFFVISLHPLENGDIVIYGCRITLLSAVTGDTVKDSLLVIKKYSSSGTLLLEKEIHQGFPYGIIPAISRGDGITIMGYHYTGGSEDIDQAKFIEYSASLDSTCSFTLPIQYRINVIYNNGIYTASQILPGPKDKWQLMEFDNKGSITKTIGVPAKNDSSGTKFYQFFYSKVMYGKGWAVLSNTFDDASLRMNAPSITILDSLFNKKNTIYLGRDHDGLNIQSPSPGTIAIMAMPPISNTERTILIYKIKAQ